MTQLHLLTPALPCYIRPVHLSGQVVAFRLFVICPTCEAWHEHQIATTRRPAPGELLGRFEAPCGGSGYDLIAT